MHTFRHCPYCGEKLVFPSAHLPALPAALRVFIQPLAGGAASVRRLHPHRLARSGLLEVDLAGYASLRRILAVYRLPVPLPQILQIVPSGADSRGARNAGRAGAALCSLIPRRSGYREAAAARRCASADGRTALYGSAGSGRTGRTKAQSRLFRLFGPFGQSGNGRYASERIRNVSADKNTALPPASPSRSPRRYKMNLFFTRYSRCPRCGKKAAAGLKKTELRLGIWEYRCENCKNVC